MALGGDAARVFVRGYDLGDNIVYLLQYGYSYVPYVLRHRSVVSRIPVCLLALFGIGDDTMTMLCRLPQHIPFLCSKRRTYCANYLFRSFSRRPCFQTYHIATSTLFSMARTSDPESPSIHNMTLPIRTRGSLIQKSSIVSQDADTFISTQADRCPFPGCVDSLPHQHSKAEGNIAPFIDEYRKAGEAIRGRWTEEQRRRIAENEVLLRQIGGVVPKVGGLSIQTHSSRGNDLSIEEPSVIVHGGEGRVQIDTSPEALLEKQSRNVIDDTTSISPLPGVTMPQTDKKSHDQAEQTGSLEWDDFPELDAKYATRDKGPTSQSSPFLNTDSPLCTGPCPIQSPHNKGLYLQQGQVPRVWNPR